MELNSFSLKVGDQVRISGLAGRSAQYNGLLGEIVDFNAESGK